MNDRTDTVKTEAAKKQLAEDREARAKAQAEQRKGKPTPTQEENDLTALGVPVTEHEDDGSGQDHGAHQTRHAEANKPNRAAYQTRAQTAS
jgi:hypothetical protein